MMGAADDPARTPAAEVNAGCDTVVSPGGDPADNRCRPASLLALFLAFNSLALHGFGGVLPWAQRMLVDKRRWLSTEEFVEVLAFGQVFPGPNVVNVALIVGDRFFGWRGAVVSVLGMLLGPSLVVLSLALAYRHFGDLTLVRQALDGMSAVAAGLIFGTALKLARSQWRHWRWLVFGVAAFIMVGVLRWPLGSVLAGLAPVAIVLAWWRTQS